MAIGSTSALMQRMMLAIRAGWQFAGKRKLYDVFGYPNVLTAEQLLAKYQRQDISSRVVDMPPEDMWAGPPDLTEPTEAVDIWKEFIRRTDYYSRVVQADKLLSFGSFSLIWLGLPGDPAKPAPKLSTPEQILYMQAYGAPNVEIEEVERDIKKPRFGQPLSYRIRISAGGTENLDQVVHYTRAIHVVDRPLQGQLMGEPRMAQVYNVLDDLLKVGGGSAELYWLTANRGMQVDVDKDMDLDETDAKALSEELDEFQHQLRRYIRTRGVKITTLGSDVADPRGVFSVLMSTLAGATSIPQRMMMGAEAGQLASEQDRANWAVYMRRRRKIFAEPYVLKPTIRKLEELGLLKIDTMLEAKFVWPDAFQMNPLEEAQTLAAKGRAVANFTRRNQFGNPLVTDEECRRLLELPSEPPTGETLPLSPQEQTVALGVEAATTAGTGTGTGTSPTGETGVGSGSTTTEHPAVVANPPTGEDAPVDTRVATSSAVSLAPASMASSIIKSISKVVARTP